MNYIERFALGKPARDPKKEEAGVEYMLERIQKDKEEQQKNHIRTMMKELLALGTGNPFELFSGADIPEKEFFEVIRRMKEIGLISIEGNVDEPDKLSILFTPVGRNIALVVDDICI